MRCLHAENYVENVPWAQLVPYPDRIDRAPLLLDISPLPIHGHFASTGNTGGDLNQLHQTLHACLRVGRLERAETILRRLNQLYKRDAPGLLAAHQDYLREMTHRIVQTHDMHLLHNLVRWFEVEMRHHGIPLDAATFALIIQAALQHESPRKGARMIRRYYNLAKEAGVETETKLLVPQLEDALAQQDAFNLISPPASHDLPELHALDIKGMGLITLKKALASMRRGDVDVPSDVARQQILERNTLAATMDRWRWESEQLRKVGVKSGMSRSSIAALMWQWHEKLQPAIEAEIRRADKIEAKKRPEPADEELLAVAPYLQTVSVSVLSAITILTCIRAVPTATKDGRGMSLANLIYSIGQWVESECEQGGNSRWRSLAFQRPSLRQTKRKSNPRLNEDGEDETSLPPRLTPWPGSIRVQVGSVLFSLLSECASIQVSNGDYSELQPVFYHHHQFVRGKKIGMVKLNEAMLDKLNQEPMAASLARHLPMLTPPKPWTGFQSGGFLEQRVPAVRHPTREPCALQYAKVACSNGDMKDVFRGLDVLGKTSWAINRGVFDAMSTAWNRGDAIADIPAENPNLILPPEPKSDQGPEARRKWLRQSREVQNELAGLRSQRSFINFQLETARAYVDETFYFPHNVDFRGRAYPLTPFLNHMGADNARGLLTFRRGRVLGERGLWWLQVHLANVFGYDKANFAERQAFTELHREDIEDSARDPLEGRRWWLEAENPWQCLATCMELAAAYRCPDPTQFVSNLPVHQDGTCNGLQHYAALGGDVAGAKQVNLEPGERPADIYTAVAEMVKTEVASDAANGHELAKLLDGKLTRKVVKQTVMTNVYGVTYIGARRQVRGQLEDILENFPDTEALNLGTAASYIVGKIFQTLSSMFTGAHELQYWLGECGARICESLSPTQIRGMSLEEDEESEYKMQVLTGGQNDQRELLCAFVTPIIWTTPLRMPVVQPYRKESFDTVMTRSQRVRLSRATHSSLVDKSRQLQAFPPNFIHSLDGTHMFLTAMDCDTAGLSFASVHDSFWTHAADVDVMARITRSAFIRMHSEDIMGRLAAEMRVRYQGYLQRMPVDAATPTGRRIRAWRVQARRKHKPSDPLDGVMMEVKMEQRRLDLLGASDAEERAKGAAMETPGSIWAETKEPTEMYGQAEEAVDGAIDERTGEETTIDERTAVQAETALTVAEGGGKGRRTRRPKTQTWAWVPLEVPPVPKKGDFDVGKLRDSKYFFS